MGLRVGVDQDFFPGVQPVASRYTHLSYHVLPYISHIVDKDQSDLAVKGLSSVLRCTWFRCRCHRRSAVLVCLVFMRSRFFVFLYPSFRVVILRAKAFVCKEKQ